MVNNIHLLFLTLLLFVISFILFYNQNKVYSYHTLNNPVGNSYVFDFLPDMPVDFIVDSGTLRGQDGFPVVQSACEIWNNVENIDDFCGNLQLSNVDIDISNYDDEVSETDNINNIVFDETGEILQSMMFSPTLTFGVGLNTNDNTGAITDIIIIINGSNLVSFSGDLVATTVHEMGHGWGLAHTAIGGINTLTFNSIGLDPISPTAIPTMAPFNNPVNDAFGRTLETDDIGSALLLYRDR